MTLPDETWPLGKPAAEGLHESFIALAAFGAGSSLCLFRQRRRRHQPEADEESDSLDGNPDIAFQPFHLTGDPVEAPRQCRLLTFGGIRRQERSDGRLGDEGLRLAAPLRIFGERAHQVWFEIDRELLLHGASQLETIAGVEGGLPRDGPHPLPEHVRLDGFIISFVHQDGEWIGRWRSFRRDRLMLGKSWLAPDPGIVRIFVR